MLPVKALIAFMAVVMAPAASVNAQAVILSDCSATNINLANPANRQLVQGMTFNPFTLDFTTSADSYTPRFTMPQLSVAVGLGPQLGSQPLSFVTIDKRLNWFNGPAGPAGAQFATTETLATPASGGVSPTNSTIATSIPATVLVGSANQGAFSDFFSTALSQNGTINYSVQGTTGTRLSAAAPASFQFCLNNMTVPTFPGTFIGWGGLQTSSLATPVFSASAAAQNGGIAMTTTVTVTSLSNIDINIGTLSLNYIYSHDASIFLTTEAGAAGVGSTILGTIEVPNFRLLPNQVNTFPAVLSLQPSDANRYATSHFLTRYVSSFGLGTNGLASAPSRSTLGGSITGNDGNIASLRPALSNLTISTPFESVQPQLDLFSSNVRITLRGYDAPNNQGVLRVSITNPFPVTIAVTGLLNVILDSTVPTAPADGIFTVTPASFIPDSPLTIGSGQSQDATFVFTHVTDKPEVTNPIFFEPSTPGYVRAILRVNFPSNNQPLFIKYDRAVQFNSDESLIPLLPDELPVTPPPVDPLPPVDTDPGTVPDPGNPPAPEPVDPPAAPVDPPVDPAPPAGP
ncbi:hypothetical protein HDU67_008811 [Dinochytrium kinnereticum]|nr:hypothetical protein HDU67_008811 [Dinochytrium kinnereticum]